MIRLERIMLLGEVAERHDNDRCEHFGNGWIDMRLFYEKLDKHIIKENTDDYEDEITE